MTPAQRDASKFERFVCSTIRFIISRETFMNIPSNAKAVLFDMDGVIFNTEDLAHNVFHELAIRFQGLFDEDDHKNILGTTELYWSQYFCNKWNLLISNNDFSEIFWNELRIATSDHLNLMPGFSDCIQIFRERGYETAIVTSTPKVSVLPLLERFNLLGLFDTIVAGDDVKNGKPFPDPYILAAKRLNQDSKDCVVIEDALSGVKSGRSAGCFVIAIPTIHALGLDYSDADIVIKNFSEINI